MKKYVASIKAGKTAGLEEYSLSNKAEWRSQSSGDAVSINSGCERSHQEPLHSTTAFYPGWLAPCFPVFREPSIVF
jgi:hypothetical protein